MKFFTISICLLFFSLQSFSQDFSTSEYTLSNIFLKIHRDSSETNNISNNAKFITVLDSVLKIPESFFYTFSSLKIGNVIAPDNTFRILTWNLMHENGTYENFGFLQKYDKESKKVTVYYLTDKSDVLKNQMQQVCSPDSWIGATYYMICQNKYDGQTFYSLIGWDPNNTYTQKKIIEILKFDNTGLPVFGIPIIELKGKGFQKRIIFEYSSKNTMMLRYDKRKKMIAFDHLSPSDFRYTDIYEFYGPDFSIDGYKFTKGKWRYQADIDIRNKRDKFSDYLPQRLINLFRKKETNAEQLGL
jgi:hypothetical protein